LKGKKRKALKKEKNGEKEEKKAISPDKNVYHGFFDQK